jgi:hypothetical protein
MKETRFLKHKDEFAESINEAARELQKQLKMLDVDALEMDSFCKGYFKECHSERLIFSLECSASIIYNSVDISGKPLSENIFVDYGAGLGTLFMLAAKLPFKQVVYNDHLPEWCESAEVLCKALNLPIQSFVQGGIVQMINHLNGVGTKATIIASRNVVEHIYDLNEFYQAISGYAPECVVYSTTTANFQNPMMRLKHYFYHKKVERKWYKDQRQKLIKEQVPSIAEDKLQQAIEWTRGKAFHDWNIAIADIKNNRKPIKAGNLRSNTCDATNGVWAEHMLSRSEYRQIICSLGFEMQYLPGFWDTNYKNGSVNLFTKLFNRIILLMGAAGVILSPFVIIIASRKHR